MIKGKPGTFRHPKTWRKWKEASHRPGVCVCKCVVLLSSQSKQSASTVLPSQKRWSGRNTVCEQTKGVSRCTSNLHNQFKHKPQLTTATSATEPWSRSPTTAPRPGQECPYGIDPVTEGWRGGSAKTVFCSSRLLKFSAQDPRKAVQTACNPSSWWESRALLGLWAPGTHVVHRCTHRKIFMCKRE